MTVNNGTKNPNSHKFKLIKENNAHLDPILDQLRTKADWKVEYLGRIHKTYPGFSGYGWYFYSWLKEEWIGPFDSRKLAFKRKMADI